MTGTPICTVLGVAILLLAGTFNADPTAWLNLLMTFVLWYAGFDWDRGVRPLDRLRGLGIQP
jgi:hypothetical protein